MSVKLSWITPSAEAIIANIARVSNPANRDNTETSARLIKYLIKNRHWSPFEMANVCIEITTTRSISAQLLRHRSFTFQEYSQRYAEVDMPELPNLRRQDAKNRQSSHDDLSEEVLSTHNQRISDLFIQIKQEYDSMLKDGVAKETARQIMPMCSTTTIIMNGTVRSWLHYLSVRTDPSTQKEHRDVAIACGEIIKEHLPNVYSAMFGEV